MSSSPIHTTIWHEEPEADSPFATRTARCHGYDVYGAMLGRARWADMTYLLLLGEAPTERQAALLDALAIALANPGPRDPAVHAAMSGGIGGSPAAAALIAALAVGAGQSGGARDVLLSQRLIREHGTDLAAWESALANVPMLPDDTWPQPEHAAGFDPNGVSAATIVLQTLEVLTGLSDGPALAFLSEHRGALEQAAGLPLAMTGVAAAALADLGCTPEQGEMLHLLLRLPGSAVHALEQSGHKYSQFPFPPIDLLDDPADRVPHAIEVTA